MFLTHCDQSAPPNKGNLKGWGVGVSVLREWHYGGLGWWTELSQLLLVPVKMSPHGQLSRGPCEVAGKDPPLQQGRKGWGR